MRNHHSLTALGGAFALLAASAVAQAQSGYAAYDELAQPGYGAAASNGRAVIVDGHAASADAGMVLPPDGAGYYAGPGYPGVPGAMFQPPYGNTHPGTLYPPQTSPLMSPWPAISPFENPQVGTTQHRIENGLWFREMLWKQRDVEASVEYINLSYQEPNDTLIGSRMGKILPNTGGGDTGTTDGTSSIYGPTGPPIATYSGGASVPINSIQTGPGAYPIPGLLQSPVILFTLDARIFPIRRADVLGGGLDSDGIRLRFGVMDEDDTGWRTSGYFAPEANLDFNRGRAKIANQKITQAILLANPNLIFTKHGAIPLIDALDPADSAIPWATYNGSTQKYDVLFRLDYSTTSAGADLNRFLGTVYKSRNMRVSSFIGGRYFYLDEHFGFRGIDSGFGYDIDYEIGNTDGDSTFRPEPNSIDVAYPLLDARLNSNVKSQMAGPQIGFRFDLGKKDGKFQVWGQSTFGLLANHEELEVNGNNIGDPLLHPEMFNLGTGEYLDNSFNDGESHTHVSPLLEQSLYADLRLATIAPFLRKNYYLQDASLRLGWTWTYIGEVSRPVDSIDWKGFPLTPSVRIDRKNFTMNTLSVGIECPF